MTSPTRFVNRMILFLLAAALAIGWATDIVVRIFLYNPILNGLILAVLLIPDQFQVDDALWKEVQRRLGRDDLDREQPQRRISAWLRERGVPYLDLLPELRQVPPLADGRGHLYHRRDTHWNRRGNEAAGAALARFLPRWLR